MTGDLLRSELGGEGIFERFTAEGHLRSWIRQQPDLTLAELQQRLQRTMRLQVSIGRLWGVLRDLQLPLKKSRFTLQSRTGRKIGSAVRRGRTP